MEGAQKGVFNGSANWETVHNRKKKKWRMGKDGNTNFYCRVLRVKESKRDYYKIVDYDRIRYRAK